MTGMVVRRMPPAWLLALAALPLAWLGRQAVSPALGALLLLALFAACAVQPGVRSRAKLAAAFLGCFVAVHLLAHLTGIYAAMVVCALALAGLTWLLAGRAAAGARRSG
jgi:hypothetical protein